MNPLIPKLREAIIAAVPGIKQECPYGRDCPECDEDGLLERPIQLADVLLAIDDNSCAVEAKTGQFGELSHEGLRVKGYPVWNLHKPLDGQSDDTLTFLAEILV